MSMDMSMRSPVSVASCPALVWVTLLASWLLASCSFLEPGMEPDVDPRTTHLAQGPQGQPPVDLGPDARSLLESFTRLKTNYFELKTKMEQVEADNERLRSRIQATEKDLSAERARRAVAEAETERLKKEVRKRDAEILGLSIKKARRDHEYYALKVAMLKDQLDALAAPTQEPYQPTSPADGRQR